MRILHVYRTFFPDTQGGLEEVIRQICRGTEANGVASRVFTTTKNKKTPKKISLPGLDVIQVTETFEIASCNVALTGFKEFKKQVKWADLIHYHFPWPFADALHLIFAKDKPTVMTYHSDIVRQKFLLMFYRPLMKRFLKSIDRVVCTSPNYFATSDVLSSVESKVEVIPIGLDADSYPEPEKEVLEKVEAEFGRDFFLFVGVLRYYKGLHILLDAIKNAPYQVVIVGSGPIELELKRQAESLDLDNVTFAGQVSDEIKVSLFRLSKSIVFPSYLRSEAFGVTLLEGAMFSKPLISTEVGSGTSHVNVHGETGFVIAPGSARALRRAMDQIHSRPEFAALMGVRAKKRFDKLFTGQLMANRYFHLYQRILGNESGEERDLGVHSAQRRVQL
ncbi:MAG: glycosyltransferase [bacterium]